MLEFFTDEIIDLTSDNTAGTLLDREAIELIVNIIIEKQIVNKPYIDVLIAKNESNGGYMAKANDFIDVLDPYING
jgi:hypothetical protein